MPAVALSRVGARVVESGPGGEDLPASAWQRLEALPDPRSPQGRIYPLDCLIAIAVCAFTAAGNDRFTAIGQWIKRADQADLARLRAPWDPLGGWYRAPDEKTIRVVLDRLDPLVRQGRTRSSGPGRAEGIQARFGAHAWVFFTSPVRAERARRLREAMAIRGRMTLAGYDRLFPSRTCSRSAGWGT